MTPESLSTPILNYLREISQLSERELAGYLQDWKLVPYVYRGRVAGVAAISGTEIHVVMKPEYRGMALRRDTARNFINNQMARKHMLTTRVLLADEKSQRFVTRVGFEETHRDPRFVYYMLTRLPFKRKE